jgi:hypothetical protein
MAAQRDLGFERFLVTLVRHSLVVHLAGVGRKRKPEAMKPDARDSGQKRSDAGSDGAMPEFRHGTI